MPTRTETDSLGSIEIEADRYWGPQTERARALFRIGDARFDPGVIRATGRQKWASAEANRRLGHVTAEEFDRWVRPRDMLSPGGTLEGGG